MRELFRACAPFLLLALLIVPQAAGAAELTIYFEKNQFPKNDAGNFTTIFPETVRELIKRTGTDAEIIEIPWQRGYDLGQTQANAAILPTTRTPKREKLFRWLGPVNRLQWIFYQKRGRGLTLHSLEDAKRVPAIGTYAKDAREQFLKDRGFRNLQSTNHQLLNVRKLMEGRIDLMVGGNLGIESIMNLAGYDMDRIEPVLTFKEVDLYIAFSPYTDNALFQRWQKAFESMKRDGTFQAMYRRDYPGLEPPLAPLPQDGPAN
ncbi:substrate-binding periplasmic protein [Salidesulfovibrio onnuriiensis]|uniref:substrate-binding periplasmic protein n=1 Tax=Salidesulfovibrio onnuriiensis TaxID=2583823 RepID=UPI0016502123|nr:ABC transporter substrate-binding protein [Salidesulfovibrio onnuriiensis]